MEFMDDLRKRYPKRGPDPKPGEALDKWASRYMQRISDKIQKAEGLIRAKVDAEDICKRTGLCTESVNMLQNYSRKKKFN